MPLQAGELAANEASDMWSLGVIAFEVLTGHALFGMNISDEEVIGMLLGWVNRAAHLLLEAACIFPCPSSSLVSPTCRLSATYELCLIPGHGICLMHGM